MPFQELSSLSLQPPWSHKPPASTLGSGKILLSPRSIQLYPSSASPHKMAMLDSIDTIRAVGPGVTVTTERNDYDTWLNEKQRMGVCPHSSGHHIKAYVFARKKKKTGTRRNKNSHSLQGWITGQVFLSFQFSLTYYNVICVAGKLNEPSEHTEGHREVGAAVNRTWDSISSNQRHTVDKGTRQLMTPAAERAKFNPSPCSRPSEGQTVSDLMSIFVPEQKHLSSTAFQHTQTYAKPLASECMGMEPCVHHLLIAQAYLILN